ncbi:hypothetical protein [Bacillus sp. es.034]|uniref:hypothetical protein n=1 Tax=Bacillus sp. es.034 TaxID=1761763 RepID=UPI000C010902|nr:hypothetical protein [Bacillus sp. es.034]PFG07632.1 hypothetical protein ATG71_4536 [Bacillus sp. es.034]
MDEVLIAVVRTMISFLLLVIVTLAIGKHINSHKNHYSFALSNHGRFLHCQYGI